MPENMALQALHGTVPQMFIDFSGTLWIPLDPPVECAGFPAFFQSVYRAMVHISVGMLNPVGKCMAAAGQFGTSSPNSAA